jgi:hypothetical protein
VPLAPSPAVGGTWRGWPGTHGIPSLAVAVFFGWKTWVFHRESMDKTRILGKFMG